MSAIFSDAVPVVKVSSLQRDFKSDYEGSCDSLSSGAVELLSVFVSKNKFAGNGDLWRVCHWYIA